MDKRVVLVFDGQVLRPERPLNIEPGTRVRATIELLSASPTAQAQTRPLRVFRAGGEEFEDEALYA